MAMGNNGVKITYIETQFVTADAASFKSLVQRLTGMSADAAAARPLHRPRPCRAAAAERTSAVTGAPTYFTSTTAGSVTVSAAADHVRTAAFAANAGDYSELQGLWDYSELFCASERCHGGSYSDFLY